MAATDAQNLFITKIKIQMSQTTTEAGIAQNPVLGTVRVHKFKLFDPIIKSMSKPLSLMDLLDRMGDLSIPFYDCNGRFYFSNFKKDVKADFETFIKLQLIELQDKNEVEICEGDIVKCWDKAAEDPTWGLDKFHIGYIKYTADCFSLCIPPRKDECTLTDGLKHYPNPVYLSDWPNAENIEVIGNIYQNPDLLGW